ncbi:MAG: DNA internalization-related competence protein ComEC/Rec2, partial [Burkholderiales bacterium]|nr:DNA internalization-related competence protein ComEC/Rec2 [Burkholderiales bacterium]
RATGYVRAQPPPVRLDARVARPGYLVQRLRMDLRDRLEANLGAVPYAGVLVALAIGDQQSIPTEQWSVFTRTGVNHLMSISGLHVTMLSGLAFVVTASVWRRMPRLLAFGPARDAAATVGLAVAVGYALIAGFAVPAQRTVWMLAAVAVCLWLRFTPRAVEILAVALLVVSLVDPMAVTAPGFWLSFAAVAVMMYAAMEGDARFHWLGVWTRVQWALFVGLLPLLLVLFGQASLVAPLANAIAVPVVSFAVVPLALLATVLPWPALAAVAHGLMALLAQGLVALSSLPLAVWTQHAPPVWAVSLALLGAGWLLAPRGVPNRGLGIVLMAPLVLLPPLAVPEGQAHIAVLDVGQGSAAVIRTRTGAYVFDTGPVWSPETDSGARIVVPYLRGEGIRQLDGLFVSHDDNDHSGGVRSILAAVPAAWVASSLRDDHPLLAGARRRLPCVAGTGWTRDGVRFDVLHPPVDGYTRPPRKDNAVSCVLRVSVGTTAVLLTADIEKENEVQLLATHAPLAAEVLIVPHHGSRTSSTAAFVAAVHPRVAVFTVGYRNRFDHPRPDVVARYEAVGAALLRSDRDGAVLLDVTARGVAVRTWRAERRRYWQTAFAGGRS